MADTGRDNCMIRENCRRSRSTGHAASLDLGAGERDRTADLPFTSSRSITGRSIVAHRSIDQLTHYVKVSCMPGGLLDEVA
jgi:hypothetical protein